MRIAGIEVLLKREHVRDCFLWGSEESPWVLDLKNPAFYGDKLGGRRGQTTSWIRMRCNDPKCTALALVHHWDLSGLVAMAVPDAS